MKTVMRRISAIVVTRMIAKEHMPLIFVKLSYSKMETMPKTTNNNDNSLYIRKSGYADFTGSLLIFIKISLNLDKQYKPKAMKAHDDDKSRHPLRFK